MNNYISHAIGKDWISLCQQVDSLGETSCMVYTTNNAELTIENFLADFKKFHLQDKINKSIEVSPKNP